jgi:imidazolonepropionase-like amidohydrolase
MTESSVGQASVLFANVRIFDGVSDSLSEPSNVLVRGSAIAAVSAQAIPAEPGEDRTEIDGAGKVLMPGLIDAHAHVGSGCRHPRLSRWARQDRACIAQCR